MADIVHALRGLPMEELDMSTLPPLTIALSEEFLSYPSMMYQLFSLNLQTGNIEYDPNRILYVDQKSECRFKVTTLEELQQVKMEILCKSVLFYVESRCRTAKTSLGSSVIQIWKGEFAVILNTHHPDVKNSLVPMFNKAADFIRQEKSCCSGNDDEFVVQDLEVTEKSHGEELFTQLVLQQMAESHQQ